MKFNQIFCDMDGVLVDFHKGMNMNINNLVKLTPEGLSLLSKKVAKFTLALKEKMNNQGLTQYNFHDFENEKTIRKLTMAFISNDPESSFYNLPHLEDGVNELWSHLHTYGVKVDILSAPVPDKSGSFGPARRGKTNWVKDYLNPFPSEIFITPANEKWKHAVTNGVPNILVDDNIKNITEWRAAGGIGFHHAPGKSFDTIQNMKNLLIGE